MLTRTLLTAVIATASLCASASAQQFVLVPDGYTCSDVTPDGEIVVGHSAGGAFIWAWKQDAAPTSLGGIHAVAVSDDGTKVLGNIYDPPVGGIQYAAIWTQAGGWVTLGSLGTCGSASTAFDLSGDGNVATGLSWNTCMGVAFHWTAATGMVPMSVLGNGRNRASVINHDGTVMGGFAQGNFSRTPAVWSGDLTGFVYDMDAVGEVTGINNDGTTTLGSWNGAAYVNDGVTINLLGSLNPGWTGNPTDISEDGQTVVGYDSNLLASQAWVWRPSTGFMSMDDVLTAEGVVGAPTIYQCLASSDDGNVIVGGGDDPGGIGYSGFIFEFDTDGSWEDVGGALAGASGEPSLVGDGELLPFASVSVTLSNALPGGDGYLIIGFFGLNAPFKGGTLVPNPDMILGPLTIDGAGELGLATFWPAGIPSDFETYYQYWIPDAAGPKGYAASNGLRSTAP